MTPTTVTKKIATKKVFNLDTLEKESKTVEYEVPADITSFEQLTNLPKEQLLKIVNIGVKRQALLDAKSSIEGTSMKTVSTFVNAFRLFPQFNSIADRKEQTAKILGWVKTMPPLVEGLKASVAASVNVDEEEDDENDEG